MAPTIGVEDKIRTWLETAFSGAGWLIYERSLKAPNADQVTGYGILIEFGEGTLSAVAPAYAGTTGVIDVYLTSFYGYNKGSVSHELARSTAMSALLEFLAGTVMPGAPPPVVLGDTASIQSLAYVSHEADHTKGASDRIATFRMKLTAEWTLI